MYVKTIDDNQICFQLCIIINLIFCFGLVISIKTLSEPVKLDWIPPNTDENLVIFLFAFINYCYHLYIRLITYFHNLFQAAEYMTQVGSENIPVSGSKAAIKRKERLEFQVPPHDLDATLCHNLSENEAAQLTQYVEKIKENSVGQGVVVRLGDSQMPNVGYIDSPINMSPIHERIVKDKILSAILTSQPICYLMHEPSKIINGSRIVVSMQPLTQDVDDNRFLSATNKNKLRNIGINTDAIESYVTNEPVYEQIFTNLRGKRVRFEDDCILGPINKFREEYMENNSFKNDMQEFVDCMRLDEASLSATCNATPVTHQLDVFNSPLAIEPKYLLRQGSLMHQETPVRKINFAKKTSTYTSPVVLAVKRDKILNDILNSNGVREAIYYPTTIKPKSKLILSRIAMKPDFCGNPYLNHNDKLTLQQIGVDTNALQSNNINGIIYDKLFQDLDDCEIDYAACCLLQPMKALRMHYTHGGNEDFNRNIDNLAAALERDNPIGGDSIATSKSSDSGFDSAPPTPNYATHPTHNMHRAIQPTQIPDDFNLVTLMDTLEIDDLPPPPPIPFIVDAKQLEFKLPTAQNFAYANEKTEPMKAVTQCRSCKNDIYAGTVAVKAERAGKEVAWHPQCFTCHTCGDLLADLVYFYHSGNIYCGRDLANILNIPRCHACDELIFTKEYTAAEGSTFHIKHFCCYQCDSPLAGQQYIPDDKTNMPLCLICYDEFHAAKCQYCKRIIGPSEEGVNWERLHWHKHCFICAGNQCGKSLIGGRFCIRNELPFCSPQCAASVSVL